MFAGLFLSLGVQIAFLQLWLEDWGLSAAEIGVLNLLAVAVRIIAGVVAPSLADRLGRPRAMIVGLALLGAAAGALHLVAQGRLEIYLLTIFLSAAYAGLMPMADAHGYAAAEREGFSYRRARSVGSFAFLVATLAGGVAVERFGANAAPIWIAVSLAVAALAAWGAPIRAEAETPEGSGRLAGPDRAGVRAFLTSGVFLLFFASVAGSMASHAVYYVYGSIHWRALGYSEAEIGALWAVGVAAEILLFFVGRTVIDALGPVKALWLASIGAALRWSAMTLDPGGAALVLLQCLHAVSFALAHLAALAFIAEAAPANRRATAQGVLTAVSGGVAMFGATALAAWAYPTFGADAYWLGGVSGALGAVAAWRLGKVWRGGLAVGGAHPPAARA